MFPVSTLFKTIEMILIQKVSIMLNKWIMIASVSLDWSMFVKRMEHYNFILANILNDNMESLIILFV